MMRKVLWSLVCLFALGLGSARADVITSLYSTGVDSSGNNLAAGANDPHYTLVTSSDPSFPGPNIQVVNPNEYPFPPFAGWHPNLTGPNAQWIAPNPNGTVANGPFDYTTTFNLTGFNPTTASITGVASSDDEIVGLVLNGHAISFTTPDQSYGSLFSFALNNPSFFVSGVNTLEFDTMNTHGYPTGLIVQMTGTANSVPEPTSMTLLGTGVASFAGLYWRKRRAGVELA
jgi:hypothetical protein